MVLRQKAFLKPSKRLRLLYLLEALSQSDQLSQNKLCKYCQTSSAMVNQYLSEMHGEGLVQFRPIDGKSYSYRLTPEGREVLRQSMETYCTEMVQVYADIKEMIRTRLDEYRDGGLDGIILFGAAETCEVLLSALRETPFEVRGIVDNDTGKQGRYMGDHLIRPPSDMEAMHAEAVVITSFGQQEDIFNQLSSLPAAQGKKIIRL